MDHLKTMNGETVLFFKENELKENLSSDQDLITVRLCVNIVITTPPRFCSSSRSLSSSLPTAPSQTEKLITAKD